MFSSILFAKSPSKQWLRLLIVLAIVLLVWYYFHAPSKTAIEQEGFEQDQQFVLKRGDNAMDDFYASQYDVLMLPEKRTTYEIEKIVEMTQPSAEHSVFLDVGSKTGHLVEKFRKKGYQIYGIDKSDAMVKKSEIAFPKCEFKCGNAETNPMEFEHNTFTHILCCGFSIYSVENKTQFFRNCYHWLMANGYLILHLVEPDKFDPITPCVKDSVLANPQDYSDTRIITSEIDLDGIIYKSEYDFSKLPVVNKETFTDKTTQKIRQNEQYMYMENRDTILTMAKLAGFIVRGYADKYNGEYYQYLYVLERMM